MARTFSIDEFAAFAGGDQRRWAWLLEVAPFEPVGDLAGGAVRVHEVIFHSGVVELGVEAIAGDDCRILRYPNDCRLFPRLMLGDDVIAREPALTRWLAPLSAYHPGHAVATPPIVEAGPTTVSTQASTAERYPGQHRNQAVNNLRRDLRNLQQAEIWQVSDIIERRRIRSILHFTRVENLPGILRRGVVPRDDLRPDQYVANDVARIDGWPEASCFSISFPNYRMFYRYRQTNIAGNWAVIAVDAEQLREVPCLFMPGNAASAHVRRRGGALAAGFAGATGLESLFAEPTCGTRVERGLTPDLTTDPQAEVLVFDVIEPSHIRTVSLYRDDPVLRQAIREALPDATIEIGGAMFQARVDFRWWRPAEARFDLDFDIEGTE